MKKTVLIYSGGLDSTTLLYSLLAQEIEVHALGIHYGQRHKIELDFASYMTSMTKVPYKVVDISGVSALFGANSQTDKSVEVPIGHYEEETMKTTVVPNRNMVMLSIAAAYAISIKADSVSYAAHGGDRAIYPDCRKEFVSALDSTLKLADWHPINLYAPFVEITKSDICALGASLGVPFEHTWSCYQGVTTTHEGPAHCGQCGTCVERKEAFINAHVEDPTEYLS